MNDRLRQDLADLSQEVKMVDLRDRARQTSRQIGQRRALVAAAAAVALIATGTVAFLRFGPDQTAPPPSNPLPSFVTESPTATPGPSGTDFAFAAPPASATKLGQWTSQPAPAFPGQAFFFTGSGSDVYSLVALANGSARISSLDKLDPSSSCILNSIVTSPDGTRVAWIRGTVTDPASGQLVVTNLATLKASAVADGVSCTYPPVWRADSRSLDFERQIGAKVDTLTVSLDTGKTTARPEKLYGYHAYVPGFAAYPDAGNIVVENDSGAVIHRVPYAGFAPVGFSIQALSYDGRYVGVNFRNTDPGRVATVARMVDLTTGREVSLPVPTGQSLFNLRFLPDGGMVMHTRAGPDAQKLIRFDRTKAIVAQVDLPPPTIGLLLGHLP